MQTLNSDDKRGVEFPFFGILTSRDSCLQKFATEHFIIEALP